ncbi:MAG TPA: DoxX family protein [Xanthobacteraceae bacterium]|nr:DoxX family protein [Xanthobacteraceae bacterium]
MPEAKAEPKLFFPGLKPFYDRAIPFSWLVIRVAVGWNLVVHGWPKLGGPSPAILKAFADLGFTPPAYWFWASCIIEFFGGIAIILGLFTRFWSAAVAIEMLLIMIAYWGNGFGWMRRGYEYVLLWGLVAFAIALRGGGPYSLDRKFGKEL